MGGLLALDTETSGLDLHHGARPFYVTISDEASATGYWEWNTDPLTRRPEVVAEDVVEVMQAVEAAEEIVTHNGKFDVKALATIIPGLDWPWEKTHDTLLAAHLLASNQPKNLTALALMYLGVDILPLEKALEVAVKAARGIVQQARLRVKRAKVGEDKAEPYANWRIAEEHLPEMPSAGESTWSYDYWMPRAMRLAKHPSAKPEWETVLRDYSNADSMVTLALWRYMREELKRRDLWDIYLERRKLLPVVYEMERRGVTINRARLEELTTQYTEEAAQAARVCVNLAASYGYELELPKGGRNKSLDTFVFDVLKLEKLRNPKAKTDRPTLDAKVAIPHYLRTLPPKSKALTFVEKLVEKRARDTAVGFMNSYQSYWLPLEKLPGWYRLHPSFNPTGTDTTRSSCSNPNGQQISKKEAECKHCEGEGCDNCGGTGKSFRSLRYCFGPAPGREWWSMDAKNLELRLPAYECGEEELIALFEKPKEPPYYGSEHLLNFSTVYPDIWAQELAVVGLEKVGPHCKKRYASTWYQRCKNGSFACGYGAMDKSDGTGTADRAFGRPGSHARLKIRFAKKEKLNQYWIAYANKHGYVETMPDRSLGHKRGYPLLCTRTEWGRILPTVPLNYHIQGAAGQWKFKGMVRCHGKLKEWQTDGFDGYLILDVHDELVFDFPKRGDPTQGDPKRSNLWRIRKLQRLMEQGGEDIGVPTPVGCEYHPDNWSEGVSL